MYMLVKKKNFSAYFHSPNHVEKGEKRQQNTFFSDISFSPTTGSNLYVCVCFIQKSLRQKKSSVIE